MDWVIVIPGDWVEQLIAAIFVHQRTDILTTVAKNENLSQVNFMKYGWKL